MKIITHGKVNIKSSNMSSIDYPVQFFLKALLVALGSEKKLCFDDFRIDYTVHAFVYAEKVSTY